MSKTYFLTSGGQVISLSVLPSLSANTNSPDLQINSPLLVPLDGDAPLTPAMLQVEDPDSPAERLVFRLVLGPSNGRLVKLAGDEGNNQRGGEAGRELNSDDTFTWSDLKLGRVRFRHRRDEARSV